MDSSVSGKLSTISRIPLFQIILSIENCSLSIWKEEKSHKIAFGVLLSVFFVVSLLPHVYDINEMYAKVIFDSLILEIYLNFVLERWKMADNTWNLS